MSQQLIPQRPLVRAKLFTQGDHAYAWIGESMEIDDHEEVAIDTDAVADSSEWHAAAFRAVTRAYRSLQLRHADKDVVIDLGALPVGLTTLLGVHPKRNRHPEG